MQRVGRDSIVQVDPSLDEHHALVGTAIDAELNNLNCTSSISFTSRENTRMSATNWARPMVILPEAVEVKRGDKITVKTCTDASSLRPNYRFEVSINGRVFGCCMSRERQFARVMGMSKVTRNLLERYAKATRKLREITRNIRENYSKTTPNILENYSKTTRKLVPGSSQVHVDPVELTGWVVGNEGVNIYKDGLLFSAMFVAPRNILSLLRTVSIFQCDILQLN